jgi:hypothetical protein
VDWNDIVWTVDNDPAFPVDRYRSQLLLVTAPEPQPCQKGDTLELSTDDAWREACGFKHRYYYVVKRTEAHRVRPGKISIRAAEKGAVEERFLDTLEARCAVALMEPVVPTRLPWWRRLFRRLT